jgi:hypothetical protein
MNEAERAVQIVGVPENVVQEAAATVQHETAAV